MVRYKENIYVDNKTFFLKEQNQIAFSFMIQFISPMADVYF